MRPSLPRPLPRCIVIFALFCLALPARAADLVVSAASSLSNALRDIAPAFEADNPGTRLRFNFAASDTLLVQIAKGAPVDILATADQEVMDRAAAQKLLLPGSRRTFAGNSMVVVMPRESRLQLDRLADLRSAAVRHVALGRPAGVPAGRYAKAALVDAGLWSAIEPKAVYAQNVRQCLDYVARGEAEAGFVYASDAALFKDKVRIAFGIATPTPVDYPIAIVAGSANAVAAQRLIDHLVSSAGQVVLLRHGFQTR